MEQSVKERIIIFIKRIGISQSKFEKSVGLSNGYLNQLRNSPSYEKIQSIISVYPELNQNWLLTGKGSMLKNKEIAEAVESAEQVYLLPVSAQGGSLNDFMNSVKAYECERLISPIRAVDFAMTISGDSMAPEYPNGSRIFVKRINERAFIEWGKPYVLDTCNGAVIKTLMPSDKEGYVKCVSINSDPIFAPFEVAFKDIYGVYKVLVCMSVK